MSVQEFRQNLVKGGARPNQFRVHLPISGNISYFMCEAASLPGQTVDILPVMFRGREVKLAGERRFDNWDVTVLNDENFEIHNYLETWMNEINNRTTNFGDVRPLGYVETLEVHQLSRNDVLLKSYKFINAWPTMVAPIQLSFGENAQISKFQVTFAYDYFEIATTA